MLVSYGFFQLDCYSKWDVIEFEISMDVFINENWNQWSDERGGF